MSDQYRIILVDDHEDMNTLISQGLGDEAIVDYAPDGYTAQKLISVKEYDLILCDINMPFMNGLMLIEEFKKKNISIPVIFISGDVNQEVSKQAFKLGAHNILSKPFKLKDLREKIKLAISIETPIEQENTSDQEVGYLYNLLKSHYYDFEKIMYNVHHYNIPISVIAEELEKKERSGKCLLDDPNYLNMLVPSLAS